MMKLLYLLKLDSTGNLSLILLQEDHLAALDLIKSGLKVSNAKNCFEEFLFKDEINKVGKISKGSLDSIPLLI